MTDADPEPRFTLTLMNDPDAECPFQDDWGWKLISFHSRYGKFEHYEDYYWPRDDDGRVNPKYLATKRKLVRGTAFVVNLYDHSGTVWYLAGDSQCECQWDTTRGAALLWWTGKPGDLGRDPEARRAVARGAMETYTAWANGCVYGFSLEDAAGELVESCWGFYDEDDMLAAVRDALPAGTTAADLAIEGEAAWLLDYHDLFPAAPKAA